MIAVLGARLLILGESLDTYQSETIFIPKLYNTEPMRHGKVVRVGPAVENVGVGDVVFFHENAGHTLRLDESTYIVLSEDDALGYSPNVVDLTMAQDTEVMQLREESERQRSANAEGKRITDELNDLVQRGQGLLDKLREQRSVPPSD